MALRGKHKSGTFLLGTVPEEVDPKAFKKVCVAAGGAHLSR